MAFELRENILTAKDFLSLRESAGWAGAPQKQIEKGLKNSLLTVAAVQEERVIGMGRLVGDGFTILYIQDLIVYPEYQGLGIGKAIVKRLIAFGEANSLPDTTVTIGLMSAKGKESFYSQLGFHVRPNPNEGAGMIMKIRAKFK